MISWNDFSPGWCNSKDKEFLILWTDSEGNL